MKTKITLETKIKKGDVMIDRDKREVRIIETLGEIYFLSGWSKEDTGYIFTINQIVMDNYELLTPEWSASNLQDGDRYYYIDYHSVEWTLWKNSSTDLFRLKMGLIVENEEAGRAKIKEIMEK